MWMAECTAEARKHRELRQKHSLSISLKTTSSSQTPPPKGSTAYPGSTCRQRTSGHTHDPLGHISPSKDNRT